MESHESTPEIEEITPEERKKTTTTAAALAAAGGLLLLISLILPWYKDDVSQLPANARSAVDIDTYTAFSGLERTDVLLAIVAIAAIVVGAVALASLIRDLGLIGWTIAAIGVAAALLVIYRGSERPEPKVAFGIETSLQFGWYLALLTSLVVVAGGVVALRKRPRRPHTDEDDDWLEDEEEDERERPARAGGDPAAGER